MTSPRRQRRRHCAVPTAAMFWKFDLHTSSQVDTLLERDDVTLQELLDEEEVLQECKAQNRKLLDFLLRPDTMLELVRLITHEPPGDIEERLRFKHPNVASEILTADVMQINDRLVEEPLMSQIYAFLEQESPLNPLLASFFSKVLGVLITRKTEQILDFLRKKNDFVSLLLKHIGTSAIMDLLLRLLACVDSPELRKDLFNWLNEEKLVNRLIEVIHPSQDDERHSNASQSLCDIIRLSREQAGSDGEDPEPLLATLEKQETVEQLLNTMLDGEMNETALVSGIQVLLTLLETRRPGYPEEMFGGIMCRAEGLDMFPNALEQSSPAVNRSVLLGIKPKLSDLHQLLLQPPKKAAMITTAGSLDPPLGNTRLHVVKLLAAILQSNVSSINVELMELDTINVLLDLFFQYVWNNFLHLQVEQCLTAVLSRPVMTPPPPPVQEEASESQGPEADPTENAKADSSLIAHLFQNCRLVERTLDAWESNSKEQANGGRRRGYMGHLARVANCLVQNSGKGPNQELVQEQLKGLPDMYREKWEGFIEGPLAEMNKRNTTDLVSTPVLHSSEDEDESDLRNIGFPSEFAVQQTFYDYQMQQMTSNFVDQFGFNEDEFAGQEDRVNTSFDRISDLSFDPVLNPYGSGSGESRRRFEDSGSDEEEDIWEDKETFYQTAVLARQSSTPGKSDGDGEESEGSSDSEEGDGGSGDVFHSPEKPAPAATNSYEKMEVDPAATDVEDVAMETGETTTPPVAMEINDCTSQPPVAMEMQEPSALLPLGASVVQPMEAASEERSNPPQGCSIAAAAAAPAQVEDAIQSPTAMETGAEPEEHNESQPNLPEPAVHAEPAPLKSPKKPQDKEQPSTHADPAKTTLVADATRPSQHKADDPAKEGVSPTTGLASASAAGTPSEGAALAVNPVAAASTPQCAENSPVKTLTEVDQQCRPSPAVSANPKSTSSPSSLQTRQASCPAVTPAMPIAADKSTASEGGCLASQPDISPISSPKMSPSTCTEAESAAKVEADGRLPALANGPMQEGCSATETKPPVQLLTVTDATVNGPL
uniref:Serine/threonine-protein phosphatase 6 regulatory subunit 3-like isoform X6 n=1 Tax=Petromyzon marinus TaxID=7757 RepID=A0AAJ7SUK3_PETMA|nr:serine/threonine-protein phosphatase 6 regulatory subunit 3-like isoform X6 [Petromyzon marinus]